MAREKDTPDISLLDLWKNSFSYMVNDSDAAKVAAEMAKLLSKASSDAASAGRSARGKLDKEYEKLLRLVEREGDKKNKVGDKSIADLMKGTLSYAAKDSDIAKLIANLPANAQLSANLAQDKAKAEYEKLVRLVEREGDKKNKVGDKSIADLMKGTLSHMVNDSDAAKLISSLPGNAKSSAKLIKNRAGAEYDKLVNLVGREGDKKNKVGDKSLADMWQETLAYAMNDSDVARIISSLPDNARASAGLIKDKAGEEYDKLAKLLQRSRGKQGEGQGKSLSEIWGGAMSYAMNDSDVAKLVQQLTGDFNKGLDVIKEADLPGDFRRGLDVIAEKDLPGDFQRGVQVIKDADIPGNFMRGMEVISSAMEPPREDYDAARTRIFGSIPEQREPRRTAPIQEDPVMQLVKSLQAESGADTEVFAAIGNTIGSGRGGSYSKSSPGTSERAAANYGDPMAKRRQAFRDSGLPASLADLLPADAVDSMLRRNEQQSADQALIRGALGVAGGMFEGDKTKQAISQMESLLADNPGAASRLLDLSPSLIKLFAGVGG